MSAPLPYADALSDDCTCKCPAEDVGRILAAADAYAEAAREGAYAAAVAQVGRAQNRDPGEPPRVGGSTVVREIEASPGGAR